jgi:hypothetical protein
MPKAPISKTHTKLIEIAVDALFERAKARLLGPNPRKRTALGGKNLVFSFVPELTLGALFGAASKEEGVHQPNYDVLAGLLKIAESYLDAQKEKTKAQVVQSVHSFVRDATTKGEKVDVETVLGGQLAELWGKVHSDVRKIVETETTIVRNMGVDDAIQRISAMQGIEDPTVVFIVVRDGERCQECTKLHLLDDKTTPRAWKRSQVSAGYHKRGDTSPSVGGLHPHCRCVMSVVSPGFGFDQSGRIVWRGYGWDEYAEQNK